MHRTHNEFTFHKYKTYKKLKKPAKNRAFDIEHYFIHITKYLSQTPFYFIKIMRFVQVKFFPFD